MPRPTPRAIPAHWASRLGRGGSVVVGWIAAHVCSVWLLCGELSGVSQSRWMCGIAAGALGAVTVAAVSLLASSHAGGARPVPCEPGTAADMMPRGREPSMTRTLPLLLLGSLVAEALADHAAVQQGAPSSWPQICAVLLVHSLAIVVSLSLWRRAATVLTATAAGPTLRSLRALAQLLAFPAHVRPHGLTATTRSGRSPPGWSTGMAAPAAASSL